ncbi:MAG: class I SAM-dependent methyltransferase [Leptospirales bacterium]
MKKKKEYPQTPYSIFAKVYDETMNEVPYLRWTSFIVNYFYNQGLDKDSLILDAGCGTGTSLNQIISFFPRALGLDKSYFMLLESKKKIPGKLIQSDILNIPLPNQSLDGMFSIHDVLNYLKTVENLVLHFKEVSRILKSGSCYIFDVSTEFNVVKNFHEKTFRETHGKLYMEWKNTYDFNNHEIISVIDFSKASLLSRLPGVRSLAPTIPSTREVHVQRIFSDKEILDAIDESGMVMLERYPDYKENHSGIENANLMVYALQKDGK